MNIYILGGGCFGTQYVRWLLTARERAKISFEKLIVVDRNKDCKIKDEIKKPEVRSRKSDWVEFLVDYIKNSDADTEDLIVPSHAAPHLLGKAFIQLLSSLQTGMSLRGSKSRSNPMMVDIPTPIGTPFEENLEKGVIAVSMATWNCPANCPEPGKCPHIHAPRDWDLEVSLRSWAEKAKLHEFYVFPARHYAFAVSAIHAQTVIDAWRSLQKRLQKEGEYLIGIATSSACHGIISVFKFSHRDAEAQRNAKI